MFIVIVGAPTSGRNRRRIDGGPDPGVRRETSTLVLYTTSLSVLLSVLLSSASRESSKDTAGRVLLREDTPPVGVWEEPDELCTTCDDTEDISSESFLLSSGSENASRMRVVSNAY